MEYKRYEFTVFVVLFIFCKPYTLLGCNLKFKNSGRGLYVLNLRRHRVNMTCQISKVQS